MQTAKYRLRPLLRAFSLICFTVSALTFLLFVMACTTEWVSQATSIVQLLVPAVTGLIGIIGAFGAGISPNVITDIQKYGAQAGQALQEVGSLIDQYNAAEATAQPGIIQEIDTALGVVNTNLAQILPLLNIADVNTQKRVQAILNAVIAEVQALAGVIPAIQGKVSNHQQLKDILHQLKSADEFKADYNSLAGTFGDNYRI